MLEPPSSRGALASSHAPVLVRLQEQGKRRNTPGIQRSHLRYWTDASHLPLPKRFKPPPFAPTDCAPACGRRCFSQGARAPLGGMRALRTEPPAADQPPVGLGKTDLVPGRSPRGQAWRPNSEDGSGVGIMLQRCAPTLETVASLAPQIFPSSRRLQFVSALCQVDYTNHAGVVVPRSH